jgi:CRISPR system Cascade subunit CasD
MVGFLCFTLEGPLASWGNIAPGEQRTSWTRPSKSAALGLVAAALGIERTQEARLAALHETLGFAVLAEQPGLPVSEFQTEQRPTAVGLNRFSKTYGRSPATRGESLKVDDIATTISRRSFHIGVRHRIALWAKGGAPEDLNAIADALERPVFALFLGRRAYAPSRPLAPQVVECETLEQALIAYLKADDARLRAGAYLLKGSSERQRLAPQAPRPLPSDRIELWCDSDPSPPLTGKIVETNTRRDAYRSTAPRLFVDRFEARVPFDISAVAEMKTEDAP